MPVIITTMVLCDRNIRVCTIESDEIKSDSLVLVKKNTPPILRRSLRKREHRDIDGLDISRADHLLRKKRRRKQVTGPVLTFDSLCNDVINSIYMMLDSPRNLYNIAFCSKRLLSIVKYEHILRSAIFQQKTAGKTVTAVLNAVRLRSIYVPSITRMLRLVNGRRCERGSLCWGFDMIGKKSSLVNFARPGIGLFLCRKCIAGMTTPFQRDTNWAAEEGIVAASTVDYSMRGLNQLCTEMSTAQPVGPIISILDIKQISHTYNSRLHSNDKRSEILKMMVKEREKNDKNLQKRDYLISLFVRAREDLIAYNKKRSDEVYTKICLQNQKRLQKLKDMHGILKELLQDHEWKDFALECRWNEGGLCFNDAHVSYSCAIVYEAMRNMINAPSSASRKRIKQAAQEIRDNFDLISRSNFFYYHFLDENDAFEGPLRTYCIDHFTPKRMFSKVFPRRFGRSTSSDFMDLIRKGDLSGAFFLIIPDRDDVLGNAFALSVEIPTAPDRAARNFRSLALSAWEAKSMMRQKWSTRNRQEIRMQGDLCNKLYSDLKSAITDYMQCNETGRFISYPNEEINGMSRLDAVETVYTRKECHKHLLDRDFHSLRELHRRFYLNTLAD